MTKTPDSFNGLTPVEFQKLQSMPQRDRKSYLRSINKEYINDPSKKKKEPRKW